MLSEQYILPPLFCKAGETEPVGITTTVPVEVLFASRCTPVDLNNLFLTAPAPGELIKKAEKSGFPRTCCSWTKGIYGAVHLHGIRKIVAVLQGDCSNSQALAEMLEYEGIECVPFAFPFRPDADEMEQRLRRFAGDFGIDMPEAEQYRFLLAEARKTAGDIDTLTWRDGKVYGLENHLWLVSASDFCGDFRRYVKAAKDFIEIARKRPTSESPIRLGMVGVPPVTTGIYDFIDSKGGCVLYNETPRQFTMPGGGKTLVQQYSRYTYPYGIRCRLTDIRREIARRRLNGIIHYVQSFCFRRIEDRMIRETVGVPVITVEQDRPGPVPGQLKTRLEAFLELLRARATGRKIF